MRRIIIIIGGGGHVVLFLFSVSFWANTEVSLVFVFYSFFFLSLSPPMRLQLPEVRHFREIIQFGGSVAVPAN